MTTSRITRVLFSLVLLAPLSLTAGCGEEVAEVETQNGEIEVNKNMDGTTDVEIDD